VLVGPGTAHPVGHVDPGQGTDGLAGGPLFQGRRQRHDRAKAAGATAAELMTTPAVTIGRDAGVAEAARLLNRRRTTSVRVGRSATRGGLWSAGFEQHLGILCRGAIQ
jgi:hypothetical protein